MTSRESTSPEDRVEITHVVAGQVLTANETDGVLHRREGLTLFTPALDLGALIAPRSATTPAAESPLDEVITLLAALGAELTLGNPHIKAALDAVDRTSTMPRPILERQYELLSGIFDADLLRRQVEREIGIDAVDGWKRVSGRDGRVSDVRAYPPRLAHILAGNSPLMSAVTVAWTALLKGVGLIKMPGDDPFTAAAILRVMADLAPDHPVVRSLSAVYWRGGDVDVESALFRPQFFDKLVVWGGEHAVRQVQRYTGPGLELVSFDPKSSISLVGVEAFADSTTLHIAAELAAADTAFLNQEACASSRVHFVEGNTAEVDAYCETLLPLLSAERPFATTHGRPTPSEIRDEAEILRDLEPDFRVWGDYSGEGLIVRSDEPLDFYPEGRTVNVVSVSSLAAAADHASVATQTVGIYPPARKAELRDRLANRGVQRIVDLGEAGELDMLSGLPHDGFHVLGRLSRWVVDQGGSAPSDPIH